MVTNLEAFENWLYIENGDVNHNGLTSEEINIMRVSWQAAQQQSAGEIAELETYEKDLENELSLEKINVLQLKADNERLREALEIIRMLPDLECVLYKCDQALSATTSQSLQAHDNEVLERAANIVKSSANSDNNVYAPSCADAIRELKGK